MSNISRAFLNSILPEGDLWIPEDGKDLDLFLEGLSEIIENPREFLEKLAFIRDPQNTPIFSDLEKEFGIVTKNNIPIADRISQLTAIIYERGGTGSDDNLESALQRAGFDLYVHSNSPAVDPDIFLNEAFQVVLGDPINAFIGDPNAYLGRTGGYVIVNGIYDYDNPISLDSELWPFVFFVGGEATRGGGGEIIDIERGEVLTQRRNEFEKIILTYKPAFTWAAIIVDFI